MRIAVDAREITGKPTGVGRYLSQILHAWAQLPGAASHEFVLCAPQPIDPSPWDGLPVTTRERGGSGTMWELLALPGLVRDAGANVLFAPGYTGPLRGTTPMVVTIHDVSFAAHPEWFSWREGLRRRTLTRMVARRAARVITVSDFSKREIVRLLGVDAGRVDVIYEGVTPLGDRTTADREPMVLYVGSLFNRRHIPALVEGFARVAARDARVRLELVGDNRTRPHVDVDALIARSGAAGRIRARSYVDDDELARLYREASAFAFLSSYEGFGLTPLEALAAGGPVVVLDTEVAREIYGPAAEFVERPDPALVASALERVLFDHATRERLLSTADAVLRRYSWRECAHRTLQVLIACATS
jgi:glycosyltransferase involved in cell wall biosynthesis